MSASDLTTPPQPRRYWVFMAPLAFLLLAGLLFLGLRHGDDSMVPSALIGHPVPQMTLPALDGLQRDGKPVPGLVSADLKSDKVTVVNVFASWCVPCRDEHPALLALARTGKVKLVAINYKDQVENARRFLGTFGNPYDAVGVDTAGRMAIEWGVYGVPETFIIAKDGTIADKLVGPILDDQRFAELNAAIDKAASK